MGTPSAHLLANLRVITFLAVASFVTLGLACGGSEGRGPSPDRLDAAADTAVPNSELQPTAGPEDVMPPELPPPVVPGPETPESDAGISTDVAPTTATTANTDGPDADSGSEAPDLGAGNDGFDADVSEVDAIEPDGGDKAGICAGLASGCPEKIAPGHLQLWLRGDQGVDCATTETPARVKGWRDLSGTNNHAIVPTGIKGPLCGTAADRINGRDVVVFPRTPNILGEEHFEVDFRSLAESPLTIAVVEFRPTAMPAAYGAWMIGSPLSFPEADRCGVNLNEGMAFRLGYPKAGAIVASFWGEGCGLSQPAPVMKTNVSVMTFAPGIGLALFINGEKAHLGRDLPERGLGKIETDLSQPGFHGKGYIGRGVQWLTGRADTRYQGSLAEVVVFNAALSESERKGLEAYFHTIWNTGL